MESEITHEMGCFADLLRMMAETAIFIANHGGETDAEEVRQMAAALTSLADRASKLSAKASLN